MSVISQARLAERNKEGRRESWLTGNLSRRRNRQDSMALINEDSFLSRKTGQPTSLDNDTTISSSNSSVGTMESPGNRRHGLIFQNSPSASSPASRTQTWEDEDNYAVQQNNLSDPIFCGMNGAETLTTESPISKLESMAYISSNSTISQPRSSRSLRGHSSVRISSQQTARSLSDSIELLSVNPSSSRPPTIDVDRITKLMKHSSGRMRGEVEYQAKYGGIYRGFCYIDEVNGSLIYEGNDRNPYPLTVVIDLRELQVRPIQAVEGNRRSLELSNRELGVQIHFLPVLDADFDHWLAALLSWQCVQPENVPTTLFRTSSYSPESRRDSRKPKQNKKKTNEVKVGNIIKVAKLLLWDNATSSTTQFSHKTSLKHTHLPSRSSWRCVSCILQDNGQFKLLTENDNKPLSIIQLSQLSRCSVQLIDRSVLDEEFCIAIFPLYAMTSSQLSFFNPIYIASESRLMHEVWFCLLRTFTVPEIYGQWSHNSVDENESFEISSESSVPDDVFRIEKSIRLGIVEAKFSKNLSSEPKISQTGKSTKDEVDAMVGDYFVEVILDGEIRARTSIRSETKTPFWREECEFQNLPPQPPSLLIVLKRVLPNAAQGYSSHPNSKSTNLLETLSWTTEVPISKIEQGEKNETWWPILDQHQERVGEILLSIKYDELVVLLSSHYQAVSELLHKFSNGLTVQISQFLPSRLKMLSELMLNIFQVSGYTEDWLTTLVEDEIDGLEKEVPTDRQIRWTKKPLLDEPKHTGMSDREQSVRDMGKSLQEEANLLFRGNSLLTQALDFHMRRVGKEYLEDLLLEKISSINTMNPDCEVDPSRILNNQDINKNWTLLYSLTKDIWDSIASSAERCPPELRQILKYIRAVAEDRYGNFLRTVVYTSVSGFLFLRFFCPALLNPKSFGLLKDPPLPKAQRTLTLIAKSLQALANFSNFGKKEAWMEPMNRFLSTHRKDMKMFIDSVCDISTEQNTSNLPASYSTPITIFGRLPPILREGFLSLPYLIDHAQNFSRLVKLWVEATDKNPKLEVINGDLFQFHQLCLKIQYRADECLRKAKQFNQNVYKQPHDVIGSQMKNFSRERVSKGSDLYSLPRARSSASGDSRRIRSAQMSSEIETSQKKLGLKVSAKEQLVLNNLKTLRGQDLMDADSTSLTRVQNREEWPLKGFLGGLRWRGKENGGSPRRDSEHDTTFSSLPEGFV